MDVCSIDKATGQIVDASRMDDDIMTGYRMLCSVGDEVKCKERMGVKLVDESGIIEVDGFYNYLTAWYNQVCHSSLFPPSSSFSSGQHDVSRNASLFLPRSSQVEHCRQ